MSEKISLDSSGIFYKFIIGFSFRRAFKFWDKSNDDDL